MVVSERHSRHRRQLMRESYCALLDRIAWQYGEQWAEMSRDARESFISKNYDIKNCNNLLALMHDLSSDTDICFSSEEVVRIAHCKTEQYAELKLCIEDVLGKSL